MLRQNGYSLTSARLAVFRALTGKEPQTIKQLLQLKPKADRASVYRTIELFERLGIIHKLNVGWKYKIELTDLFHNHHHHLHCTECQIIIPLAEDDILEQRIRHAADKNGFSVEQHQLEIIGKCASCSTN